MRRLLYILLLLIYSCNSSKDEFKLCNSKMIPYYSATLKPVLDFYETKRYYSENYRKVDSKLNSGIVKIRFDINCKGETGNFIVSEFDLKFQETKIDSAIVFQLLDLTKALKWESPISHENKNVNCHKFYAFKINDGIIIDILPK